jgi:hypothetical protein
LFTHASAPVATDYSFAASVGLWRSHARPRRTFAYRVKRTPRRPAIDTRAISPAKSLCCWLICDPPRTITYIIYVRSARIPTCNFVRVRYIWSQRVSNLSRARISAVVLKTRKTPWTSDEPRCCEQSFFFSFYSSINPSNPAFP